MESTLAVFAVVSMTMACTVLVLAYEYCQLRLLQSFPAVSWNVDQDFPTAGKVSSGRQGFWVIANICKNPVAG